MFTVNTDTNGYILSISHTKEDNVPLNLEEIDMKYLNAYKLSDNKAVIDSKRKAEIVEQEQNEAKQTEIESLKKSLADTDYIVSEAFENVLALDNPVTFISDFIKILVQYNSKYATAIANRKIWRDRIEELSK